MTITESATQSKKHELEGYVGCVSETQCKGLYCRPHARSTVALVLLHALPINRRFG